MSFGTEISQLILSANDNATRNNQAHIDLSTSLYEMTDLVSPGYSQNKPYSYKRTGWKNIFQTSEYNRPNLKFENGKLQSAGYYQSDSFGATISEYASTKSDSFLKSMWIPDTGSFIPDRSGTKKYVPFCVLNASNTNIQYIGADPIWGTPLYRCIDMSTADTLGEPPYDFTLYNTKSFYYYTYDSSTLNSTLTKEITSMTPSIKIDFSIHVSEDNDLLNRGCLIGIFFLNKELSYSNNYDLSYYSQQVDGIASFIYFTPSLGGSDSVIDNYQITESEKLSLTSLNGNPTLYFARVNRSNFIKQTSMSTPTYYYSYFPYTARTTRLQWEIAQGGYYLGNTGQTYTNGLPIFSNPKYTCFYDGEIRSSLKIEFGRQAEDNFVVLLYLNDILVQTLKLKNVDPNERNRWFNQNHIIPGIICNAPDGMVKIHNFEIGMF